jgi:hypothetical protein
VAPPEKNGRTVPIAYCDRCEEWFHDARMHGLLPLCPRCGALATWDDVRIARALGLPPGPGGVIKRRPRGSQETESPLIIDPARLGPLRERADRLARRPEEPAGPATQTSLDSRAARGEGGNARDTGAATSKENSWPRWRNVGAFVVGLATVIGAIVAVLEFLHH